MTPIKELPVLVTPASRPTFERLLTAQICHEGLQAVSRDRATGKPFEVDDAY